MMGERPKNAFMGFLLSYVASPLDWCMVLFLSPSALNSLREATELNIPIRTVFLS